MRNEYRVIHAPAAFSGGYLLEMRRWWSPWWECVWDSWTQTVEEAEAFARRHAAPVVKNLGRLP